MAGHSKWVNIRHRKAEQNAKKGKIFSKIIRKLTTTARLRSSNNLLFDSRLRNTVNKALLCNVNRKTVNRAINRGLKNKENNTNNNIEEIFYEGYSSGGIAVMVKCISENRNRIASELRYVFNKCSGKLGITNSVAYLFKKVSVFSFKEIDEKSIMEMTLKINLNNIEINKNGTIDIYVNSDRANKVKKILEEKKMKIDFLKINMVPLIKVKMNTENKKKLSCLINMLENCNDVQEIYHNGDNL